MERATPTRVPEPLKMLTPPSSTIVMMSSPNPLGQVAADRSQPGGEQHPGQPGHEPRRGQQDQLDPVDADPRVAWATSALFPIT